MSQLFYIFNIVQAGIKVPASSARGGPIFGQMGISIDRQLVCKLKSHWWSIGHLAAYLDALPFEFWR